jgi:hypothetical protein
MHVFGERVRVRGDRVVCSRMLMLDQERGPSP